MDVHLLSSTYLKEAPLLTSRPKLQTLIFGRLWIQQLAEIDDWNCREVTAIGEHLMYLSGTCPSDVLQS
jgi:hypothetical protein